MQKHLGSNINSGLFVFIFLKKRLNILSVHEVDNLFVFKTKCNEDLHECNEDLYEYNEDLHECNEDLYKYSSLKNKREHKFPIAFKYL